ncbi:MAG TPA: hypothetical protein PK906_11750 [Spirochaetota bacterium]|nr:hypothetical protein [Spirochaetota bacterium]
MKYILSGFFAGVILSLLIFQGVSASELHAGFYFDLSGLENMPLTDSKADKDFYVLPHKDKVYLMSGEGVPVKRVETSELLSEFSGNGRYYIQYGKVGTSIELLGYTGERYWKMKSREKPLLSWSGRLILLLIGDHSRIRIFDTDGNPAGAQQISGRLCTSVEFSELKDYASCGFADGTYFFINEKGDVINRGELPSGNMVKTTAISSNGRYGVVHYGTEEKDGIRIIDIAENSIEESDLTTCHKMKAAICVTGSGETSILDGEVFIVFDDDADIEMNIKIPPKRPGQAAITKMKGYWFLAYTKISGESQLYIISEDGEPFYGREFAGESYLDATVRDGAVVVRGSDSFFSYKLHVPGN